MTWELNPTHCIVYLYYICYTCSILIKFGFTSVPGTVSLAYASIDICVCLLIILRCVEVFDFLQESFCLSVYFDFPVFVCLYQNLPSFVWVFHLVAGVPVACVLKVAGDGAAWDAGVIFFLNFLSHERALSVLLIWA